MRWQCARPVTSTHTVALRLDMSALLSLCTTDSLLCNSRCCNIASTLCALLRFFDQACPESAPDAQEITSTVWLHWQWLARHQGWIADSAHARGSACALEPDASFSIPGRNSLAHRMLRTWIDARTVLWSGSALPDCIIDEGRCGSVQLEMSICDNLLCLASFSVLYRTLRGPLLCLLL